MIQILTYIWAFTVGAILLFISVFFSYMTLEFSKLNFRISRGIFRALKIQSKFTYEERETLRKILEKYDK